MKCFYHTGQDAVGTCKSCDKGLCPDCAVDLGKGLACRDRCEADVRSMIALIDTNIEVLPKGADVMRNMRKNTFVSAVFFGSMGVMFLLLDIITGPTYVMGGLGVICMAYGGYAFRRGMTIPK
jgi:hypothetical protein